MSARCSTLVRVANLKVSALAITYAYGFDNHLSMRYMEANINLFPVDEWAPSLRQQQQQQEDAAGPYRLTQWNSLQFHRLDTATALQIVAIFPGVIEFTFISWYTDVLHQLVAMLEAEQWRRQLLYFVLVDYHGEDDALISPELNGRLMAAVNALEKLDTLVFRLKTRSISVLYELPIAARLRAFGISTSAYGSSNEESRFLPFLVRGLGSNDALDALINWKRLSGKELRDYDPLKLPGEDLLVFEGFEGFEDFGDFEGFEDFGDFGDFGDFEDDEDNEDNEDDNEDDDDNGDDDDDDQ